MSGNTSIARRCPAPVALALLCLVFTWSPAMAFEDNKEDEPVGWPLKRSEPKPAAENNENIERQILGDAEPSPTNGLPESSEVTERALAAWSANAVPSDQVEAEDLPTNPPSDPPSEKSPDSRSATAPTNILSPEIAPLKRITPPVRHELILYAPGDFSISVATAERLDQIAMRLRGTRDRISIIAHSGAHSGPGQGTGPGTGSEDAQISTHEAVKLSFKRAMLVRLYLIEEGVSPDQIDLEALPQAEDGGPRDRVEISATSKAARR